EAVAEKARQLGYDVEPYPAMALGSFEVTPLQHTAAIAAFANGGVYIEPYFIQRVEDSEGNVIYEAAPHSARVWSEETAYIMLDLMHGNVVDRDPATGFSNRASVPGRWVAGKTGTTNDEKDIWFVGLTPGLAASVWIGNDDNTRLPSRMTLSDGTVDAVNSSRQPIYVWNDFVGAALRGRSGAGEGFPVPEGIVFHKIDLKTGAPSENGVTAAFRRSDDLAAQQLATAVRLRIPIDTATGQRATVDTPADSLQLIDDTLTAVDGLKVGHWTDPVARTGCTVVLAPPSGCIGSGRALGPAPGSRESALLEADRTVDLINAVLLTGGSAFGLAAATGVMEWLEARDCGYATGYACVPIVPAAVLYDLGVGDRSEERRVGKE